MKKVFLRSYDGSVAALRSTELHSKKYYAWLDAEMTRRGVMTLWFPDSSYTCVTAWDHHP